jgi:hypothetical protein
VADIAIHVLEAIERGAEPVSAPLAETVQD